MIDIIKSLSKTILVTNVDDAISKKHTQNTDTKLDDGGLNEVSAAQVKSAVTDDHTHSNKTTLDNSTESFTTAIKNKVDGIVNPMLYKGGITLNSDFPTLATVQAGWTYTVLADVTDNDADKTNTGQAFLSNAEIAWNGATWTALGYSAVKSVNGETGIVSLSAGDVSAEPANANIQNHISSTTDPHKEKRFIIFKCLADDEVLSVGDGKFRFTIPTVLNGMNLIEAHVHVYTVSSSGNITIAVFNETQTADMLSVNMTVEANEYDSKDATTQPDIDENNDDVVTGDVIRIDADAVGTGAKGLEIRLTFQLP